MIIISARFKEKPHSALKFILSRILKIQQQVSNTYTINKLINGEAGTQTESETYDQNKTIWNVLTTTQ